MFNVKNNNRYSNNNEDIVIQELIFNNKNKNKSLANYNSPNNNKYKMVDIR